MKFLFVLVFSTTIEAAALNDEIVPNFKNGTIHPFNRVLEVAKSNFSALGNTTSIPDADETGVTVAQIAVLAVLLLLGLLSCGFNAGILFTTISLGLTKTDNRMINYVNLAAGDFFTGIHICSLFLTVALPKVNILKNILVCGFIQGAVGVSVTVSNCSVLLVLFRQYISIRFPFNDVVFARKGFAIISCASTWVFAILSFYGPFVWWPGNRWTLDTCVVTVAYGEENFRDVQIIVTVWWLLFNIGIIIIGSLITCEIRAKFQWRITLVNSNGTGTKGTTPKTARKDPLSRRVNEALSSPENDSEVKKSIVSILVEGFSDKMQLEKELGPQTKEHSKKIQSGTVNWEAPLKTISEKVKKLTGEWMSSADGQASIGQDVSESEMTSVVDTSTTPAIEEEVGNALPVGSVFDISWDTDVNTSPKRGARPIDRIEMEVYKRLRASYMKSVKTVAMFVAAYVVFNFPYCAMTAITAVCPDCIWEMLNNRILRICLCLFFYCNSIANPILYTLRFQIFRKTLKNKLTCGKSR